MTKQERFERWVGKLFLYYSFVGKFLFLTELPPNAPYTYVFMHSNLNKMIANSQMGPMPG